MLMEMLSLECGILDILCKMRFALKYLFEHGISLFDSLGTWFPE